MSVSSIRLSTTPTETAARTSLDSFAATKFAGGLMQEPSGTGISVMKKVIAIVVLGGLAISGCKSSTATQFLDGDIIFHTSLSAQSSAIQKATHSRYSHMGIIFLKSGEPYVYEAIRTVQYTPLKKWIALRYVIGCRASRMAHSRSFWLC